MGNTESILNEYNRIHALEKLALKNKHLEAKKIEIKKQCKIRLDSQLKEIISKIQTIDDLTAQNTTASANNLDLLKQKSCLGFQNEELALNMRSYHQQTKDLKSKLQKLCEIGPNCETKSIEHIKDHHPEKIDFATDDWYLAEPEEPKSICRFSTVALKTVIEEEFNDLRIILLRCLFGFFVNHVELFKFV